LVSIDVAFFGSLARDGELKTSKAGRSYLRLNVRVGNADAQFINVMAFDEQAIEQAEKLVKGAKVYVEGGGLKIDEWVGSDGAKRHGLSCMSWHCRLAQIGSNKPRTERQAKPPTSAPRSGPVQANTFHSDEVPF
jgi:single-stranded DNA-binding protein